MKNAFVVAVALCAAGALAMPTKDELTKAQPLVAELMAPAMADFKAAGTKDKAAGAVKVADTSVGFAEAAETEAAKFLLLKGAVNFYTRGEAYDKAADAVADLQAKVKDVPSEVIAEITGKATGKISETKAPRLFALYRMAKLQVRAASEAKALALKLKKVKSDALQRRYAEALAGAGDWKAAYGEFAKLSDAKLVSVVDAETKGKAKNAESGEFWWAYKPDLDGMDEIFKSHAAGFYRKALAAGEIAGLKKNIVEQRIGEYGDAAETVKGKTVEGKQIATRQLTYKGFLTRVNTLLWNGVSVNDIRSFTATMSGGAVSHPGEAVGFVMDSGDGWKAVQFQHVDGAHLKCVYARFEQRGGEVRGYVERGAYAGASVAMGTDFRTVKSASGYGLSDDDKKGGYGIKDLVVTVGSDLVSERKAKNAKK